ncbi:hypothetical protein R6Q59_026519 [Mikania micrantha]
MKECVAFLDLLQDQSYVMKNKTTLKTNFLKLVKWFFKDHLKTDSGRPYPPKLPNGMEVDLFDLYMYVKEEGGYNKASDNCKWLVIASYLGLPLKVCENLKIIYFQYLSFLEWIYEKAKERLETMEEGTLSKVAKSVWKKRKVEAVCDFPPSCGPNMLKEKENANDGKIEDQENDDDNTEEFEDEEDFVLVEDKDMVIIKD